MEKKASKIWPEIIISQANRTFNQAIRRAVVRGDLRKIAPKIYTSNFKDSFENIVKRHRYQILNELFPGSVISHQSALEGGFSSQGKIILSYSYSKKIELPGLSIQLIKGPNADSEDTPFLENLHISSRARALMENLKDTAHRGMVEERLDRIARIYGEEELNRLRDQARDVAARLKMERQFKILERIIGSLLGTQKDSRQATAVGLARKRGEPYDPGRFELFATLGAYLQQQDIPPIKQNLSQKGKTNLSFFEAYFSNYIEGTIFQIEEAEKIIFDGKIFPNRHEDSHDILGTYQIISNPKLIESIPQNSEEFIHFIKTRHAILMEARKDKMPGIFKETLNRAGSTVFVKPEEVKGTLKKGFEIYQRLPNGIKKAIFMMFLVSEVHPFVDGNGRIARIMMNAELETAKEFRIIIPNVFREDYLLALRRLTRKMDPAPYVKMLLHAQQFTASINYEDYGRALAQFLSSNAFMEPNESKLIINKVINLTKS